MAALQLEGLDTFDGGPPTAPPRRPAEISKWELPPQVSLPYLVTKDSAAADNLPSRRSMFPATMNQFALSKAQLLQMQEPAQEGDSEIERG